MSVNSGDLSNPERGMERRTPEQGSRPLSKREEEEARERETTAKAQRESAAKVEAKLLRERVAVARTLAPSPEELHWRERWDSGRNAACDTFEATEGTVRERVVAARSLVADPAMGCRDCFERGRNAACRVLEGGPTR